MNISFKLYYTKYRTIQTKKRSTLDGDRDSGIRNKETRIHDRIFNCRNEIK